MYILRLGVLVMMLLFGAGGMLIGGVTMYSANSVGSIEYTATLQGRTVTTLVSRTREPDRFWQMFAMFGAGPFFLGAAVAWFGWRRLKTI